MANRSELREKIMTIIYQITLYKNNKMNYNVDDVIKENNIEVVEEVKTKSTEKTNTATIVLMVVLVVIGGAGLLYLVSKSSK